MSHKIDRIDPNTLAGNPRCTLASWLKYQPLVLSAYQQHPRPFSYTPSSMSAATVASRLRDAIRGALAFGYDLELPGETNEVRLTALLRWYSEIIIKHDKTTVHIGPAERVQSRLSGEESGPSPEGVSLTFDTLSFEEVSAFQLLLSNNRIVGPVRIKNPPDITLLPARPNVETAEDSDGNLLLF